MGHPSHAQQLAVGDQLIAHDTLPWYRRKNLILLNLILMVPFVSQAGVGFDSSMMNGLQTLPQWNAFMHKPNASILGTMNAMYPLGKFFGVFITAYLGDRFGRKVPIWIGLVLLLLAAGLQGGAVNIPMFIVARLLIGFATAFISQSSPILLAELAYPTHRGRISSMYYSTSLMGAIIAAWTTYGTFKIPSDWSWRIPSLLQGAIPFFQLLFVYFVPESPRWLIAHGKSGEARRIFVKWHANGDETSALVDFEMREIEESLEIESTIKSQTSYLDLVRTVPNRRRTLIAVIVGWYATWGGIAVVTYYLFLVLNTIGITDGYTQALINGCLQIWNFLVTVVAGSQIDRIGRRPLWLWSAGGMTICYIVWTVLTSQFAATGNPAIGYSVLAFIFLYEGFFDIGICTMIFAYPIEVYQYTLRGRGLTLSIAVTEIGLILGQFVNPLALTAIGWKYYIVFTVLLGILCVLVYFLFPETNGRTLEEIAEIFEGPRERSANRLEKEDPPVHEIEKL